MVALAFGGDGGGEGRLGERRLRRGMARRCLEGATAVREAGARETSLGSGLWRVSGIGARVPHLGPATVNKSQR